MATKNQIIYRWLQWSVIVLAAITPVLIELNLDIVWAPGFAHVPTATATVVAILTAGLRTFEYQENWINYRTTCETQRKEKYFYEVGLREYGSAEDKEALFVDRVESLISRENTMWVSTHEPEPKSEQRGKRTEG